jgi:hypothetical protein
MAVTIDGSAGVTTNAGGSVNPSTTIDGINYSCRAWVNFDGTGTPAIRASGNVSSITDNGAGDYTINFTTAMPDVDYSTIGTNGVTETTSSPEFFCIKDGGTYSTTAVQVIMKNGAAASLQDLSIITAAIFR